MSAEKTVPHPYFGRPYTGYVVNTPLSEGGQNAVGEIQQKYKHSFGDSVYLLPPESLHITLCDWLAPLVDYGQDKDELFEGIFDHYDRVLTELVTNIGTIAVNFDSIATSPEAVFISGVDKGQFQTIRNDFMKKVNLLPNTKLPPKIIHCTIVRFLEELNLEEVRDFTSKQSVDFQELVTSFRLIRSTDTLMDELRVIRAYNLQ